MKVRIFLNEEMLGMTPSSKDIYQDYIMSKNKEKKAIEDELEAIQDIGNPNIKVFARNEKGNPIMWDYQIKGFFKDACYMLSKAGKAGYKGGKNCAALKAYKKAIDGLLFVFPRQIEIKTSGDMGYCSRPLRAMTMQGERISIEKSETVPAGSTMDFEVVCLDPSLEGVVKECLDYGEMRGLGQWRNSGVGVFSWEEI